MIAFCGLDFPDGQPRRLLPEELDEATGVITFPSATADSAGIALRFLGEAYDFVGAEFAIPYCGALIIANEGDDAPCEITNVEGETRPARFFVYRDHTAPREKWLGLLVFEHDEPAMNMARNSRDLRMPPRDAYMGAPAAPALLN